MTARGPYKSDAQKLLTRLAKNERRRIARKNDPTYRDRANEYQRRSQARCRINKREKDRAWRLNNQDLRKAQRTRRRGRVRDAAGSHSAAQLGAILVLQGGGCAYCGSATDLHVDHIVPLARGGSNWPWNLQFLCATHNIAKGATIDEDYRHSHGFAPKDTNLARFWGSLVLGVATLA